MGVAYITHCVVRRILISTHRAIFLSIIIQIINQSITLHIHINIRSLIICTINLIIILHIFFIQNLEIPFKFTPAIFPRVKFQQMNNRHSFMRIDLTKQTRNRHSEISFAFRPDIQLNLLSIRSKVLSFKAQQNILRLYLELILIFLQIRILFVLYILVILLIFYFILLRAFFDTCEEFFIF